MHAIINRSGIRSDLILIIFLTLVGLFYLHLKLRVYAFDDAYLHFRVARNLVEHGEPYLLI